MGSYCTAPGEQWGVRCLAQGHQSRAGGELGPLQVAVHTPYVGVGDLNRRPYGSQSKSLVTEPLPDRATIALEQVSLQHNI